MLKKIIAGTLTVVMGVSVLPGCTNMNKQDVGTVSGGVIGGLVGSRFGGGGGQVLATGIGVMAGALIGGAIGKNMDETDQLKMNAALNNNSVGQPAYWKNDKTGNSYTVTPTKNVALNGNPYCREYRTNANIGGKVQQIHGTACRQPDGSWQIQNS